MTAYQRRKSELAEALENVKRLKESYGSMRQLCGRWQDDYSTVAKERDGLELDLRDAQRRVNTVAVAFVLASLIAIGEACALILHRCAS